MESQIIPSLKRSSSIWTEKDQEEFSTVRLTERYILYEHLEEITQAGYDINNMNYIIPICMGGLRHLCNVQHMDGQLSMSLNIIAKTLYDKYGEESYARYKGICHVLNDDDDDSYSYDDDVAGKRLQIG